MACACHLYCRLFHSRGYRLPVYHSGDRRLVRATSKALMDSAEQYFRAGLVNALFNDGDSGLAYLARERLCGRSVPPLSVCRAARSEYPLVSILLRHAPHRVGTGGHYISVGRDSDDDYGLLARTALGGPSHAALPSVGHVRLGAELLHMENERLTPAARLNLRRGLRRHSA